MCRQFVRTWESVVMRAPPRQQAPDPAVIKTLVIRLYRGSMNGLLVGTIGMTGAVLTTVCWLPQAIKIVRSRDTTAFNQGSITPLGPPSWTSKTQALRFTWSSSKFSVTVKTETAPSPHACRVRTSPCRPT